MADRVDAQSQNVAPFASGFPSWPQHRQMALEEKQVSVLLCPQWTVVAQSMTGKEANAH